MKTKKPTGYILYKGKSLIDNLPIVVIAIVKSSNKKTGDMIQTYILVDNGLTPFENAKLGNDFSVCGDCKHRPTKNNTCYVTLFQGANQVYKSYKKGSYPFDLTMASTIATDRVVRIGSYGNPSSVPVRLWDTLTRYAKGKTSYEHNWIDKIGNFDISTMQFSMASVDNETEYHQAKKLGYRTFRVKHIKDSMMPTEIICPASEEAGRKATCQDCKLCSGNTIKAKDIVINVHGAKRNNFKGISINQV